MKDAGYQHKRATQPAIASGGSNANTKIYPGMNVDHKSMPHLKKHQVDDTGEMKIRYKVTAQHQYKSGEGDTSFDVTHYEPAKKVKGKSEKELQDEADKTEEEQPTAKQE